MNLMVEQESQIKQFIQLHDFNSVIESLRYSLHWSDHEINAALQQYKNFLFLKWKYGSHYQLPPSVDIDEVWHAHILHTKDYDQFCKHIFGTFLHHHPSEERDKHARHQMQILFDQQTQTLYQKEFGEFIYSVRQHFLQKFLHRVSFFLNKGREK